jgi:hypothetical protein
MADNKNAKNFPNAGTLSNATLARLCEMAQGGRSQDEILQYLQENNVVPGTEPLNAGIIRTRKGALMVRVSDDRWPIAMYRKDWRILLAKIPAIKEALDKLNILEENPQPSAAQASLREDVEEEAA